MLAVLAAVALVVAGVIAFLLHDQTAAFHAMVAEMRAAGEPTRYEDLAPAVDPDQNGVADLDAACAWLVAKAGPQFTWKAIGPWSVDPNEDVSWFEEVMTEQRDDPVAILQALLAHQRETLPWWERTTPEQLAELAAFLDTLAPFLDRVEAACAKPHLVYGVRRDSKGDLDWRVGGREGREVLSALALAARDPATRLRAIRAQLTIADKVVSPVLRAFGTSAQSTGIHDLRIGLEANALDAVAARAALDALLRHDWIATIPARLRAECVGTIEGYRSILDGRFPTRPWYKRVADRIRGKAPPVLSRETGDELVRFCGVLRAGAAELTSPRSTYLERILAVDELGAGIARTVWSVRRTEAGQRLARVALAACAHRKANGDWPNSLDELAPLFPDGIPLDPFGEQPFSYERTGAGVRLSSACMPEYGGDAATQVERDAARREENLLWDLR